MATLTQAALALILTINACSKGPTLPMQEGVGGREQTGLEGTVRRAPTQGACRQGESCDEPLQATFSLQQDGRVIARFTSDENGHFLVHANPGPYVVVPDEPVGIGQEAIEVTIGPEGLTQVNLSFDTGIR